MRWVLRAVVALQLFFAVIAADTIRGLVAYGSEPTPRTVLRVTVALAATLVALRATFGPDAQTFWRTTVLVACQALVVGAGLMGAIEITPNGVLPPNEIFGSTFVLGTTWLVLFVAAGLAGVSTFVAFLQAIGRPAAATARTFPTTLGVWLGGAVLATCAVGAAYTMRFHMAQRSVSRVEQLYARGDGRLRSKAAELLIALPAANQRELRPALEAGLARPDPCDQVWAAYVLIATDADDDGRAMARLREILGTPDSVCAVQRLSILGAKAAPALPELVVFVRYPVTNVLGRTFFLNAVNAITRIGAPAAEALPFLVARANEAGYPEVRQAAARAIDEIDPTFASRCIIGTATMVEALAYAATRGRPIALRPACLPDPGPAAG